MNVLSPVEKLILLRKKYKINQKDLAGENMSRSHLAMIETGKNSLSEHIALLIVENFNNILKSRGINDTVKLENLMETKEMQIQKLKNKFLEKLEDEENLETTVSEIESYASEYDTDTKILLYKKIGDLFYEKKNPHRATSFYLRIINDLIIKRDSKTLGEISVTLVRIYLQTENYKAAVDLENLIKSELVNFSLKDRSTILYNLGIINDSLKNHKKALEYFEEVENYITEPEEIFDVKNFQALSLADLGELGKSTSIYRSLMLIFKEPHHKLYINDNLLYIAELSNDIEKIKFYFRKLKKVISKQLIEKTYPEFGIEEVLFFMGKIALKLSRKKDALYYFNELCQEKTNRNVKKKFKAIVFLLTLYSKKNLKEIIALEKFYFKLLEREKELSVGFEFISFYSKENLKEEQEKFLKKIKEFY